MSSEVCLPSAIHFSIFSSKDLGHSPLGSSTSRNPRSNHVGWFAQAQDLLQQSRDKPAEGKKRQEVHAILELLLFSPNAMTILLSFKDVSKITLWNLSRIIMGFVLNNLLFFTESFVQSCARCGSIVGDTRALLIADKRHPWNQATIPQGAEEQEHTRCHLEQSVPRRKRGCQGKLLSDAVWRRQKWWEWCKVLTWTTHRYLNVSKTWRVLVEKQGK